MRAHSHTHGDFFFFGKMTENFPFTTESANLLRQNELKRYKERIHQCWNTMVKEGRYAIVLTTNVYDFRSVTIWKKVLEELKATELVHIVEIDDDIVLALYDDH